MPRVPVPPEVDAFLARPNPAVVATVSPSGAPHTAATWYDWEDGRVLLNMDETRLRLRYLRRNPDDPPEIGLNFDGYNFWLNKVNEHNGNFIQAEMVKSFIVSGEYRGRFGQ